MLTEADLYEVQRVAISLAEDQSGFAFFMEQGLGKTLTAIFEFHTKAERGAADVMFVICGRTMRGSWQEEIEDRGFAYPVYPVISAEKTFKALRKDKPKRFVVITHYEQFRTQGAEVLKDLLRRGYRVYAVADESIRIRGHTSVTSEAAYMAVWGLSKITRGKKSWYEKTGPACAFVRAMSGTPAPEGVHDLWAQFRFIGKMEKTPYFAFRNTYCVMGGFENKKVVGSQNLDILRMRTGSYAFRAKKEDWTDLPEKIWLPPHQIEMEPSQREAYSSMLHDKVIEFEGMPAITVEMAVSGKTKLQQIGSGWVYDNDRNPVEIVPFAKNPKINALRDILAEISSKVLVFYFFRETKRILETFAKQTGKGYVFMEGRLPDVEFDRRKRLFNNDDDIQYAFCQIDACKEGLTLLGTSAMPCHNTVFFENTYSNYARTQGEDRNHRHGQKYPVTYHDICVSREDRNVVKALQKKKGLQAAILAEYESVSGGLPPAPWGDGELDDADGY